MCIHLSRSLSLALCACVSNNKPIHGALYNSWRSDAFHTANCYKFNRKIRKWDLKCSFHNFHLPFAFFLWTNTLVRASLFHFNTNSMEMWCIFECLIIMFCWKCNRTEQRFDIHKLIYIWMKGNISVLKRRQKWWNIVWYLCMYSLCVANGESFFSSLFNSNSEFYIETCDKEVSLFKEFNK